MSRKNQPNKPEFSKENKNLELVKPENAADSQITPLKAASDQAVELADGKLNVRKGGNIIIGSMNVMVSPFKKHLQDRHEKFYKESNLHLAADIILVLIILSLAAALVIINNFQPKPQIDLQTVLADESVASGQAETFTISYKNNGKVDINNSSLSVTFPKNFALLKVSPENNWSDQTNTYLIGDLPRGANGQIKIIGQAYGPVGSTQSLAYSLNYARNGQTGNLLGSYLYSLDSSALSASFDAPKAIYQNIDFGGNITIKNTGRADIENEIDLAFANPELKITNISSDQAALINGQIIVNGLKAGASAAIEYEAVTDAPEGSLSAILETDLNLAGQKFKQAEARKTLNITAPKFSVTITADQGAINSGQTVDFKLNFRNLESSAISSTTLTITPSDSAAALENLILNKNSAKYKINGNLVELGTLPAGADGEIDFQAVLSRRSVSANQQTGIAASVNYQIDGRPVSYEMFSPKIKFNSNLQVGSKALYYSAQGDQLGIGPLPPAVDIPTKYWIFWEINNSGNALKNLTVSADLPANVGWTGQKTVLAGDLRYGEISHKAIWTIDDVAASGGNYRAGFEVELIPTIFDLGKIPNIALNIRYSATDSFTGQNISGVLSNLTADLKDDPAASGKGTVAQIKIVK